MTSIPDDIYAADTSSVGRSDGIRDLQLSDRWNTPLGRPNGGYLLATMLRGTSEETAFGHDPLYASISYLAAPQVGAAELRVHEVKRGRRVQTAETRLVQDDKTVALLVAGFGPRDGGRTVELGAPPQLPTPADCADAREHGLPTGGLFDRIDYRFTSMPGWATGTPSGDPTLELWQRLAGGRAHDAFAPALLVDSSPPPIMDLGEFGSVTVNLTVHFHRTPTAGWLATRLTTRHLASGFHDEDCELWDEAGNLIAQSRQVALLA